MHRPAHARTFESADGNPMQTPAWINNLSLQIMSRQLLESGSATATASGYRSAVSVGLETSTTPDGGSVVSRASAVVRVMWLGPIMGRYGLS